MLDDVLSELDKAKRDALITFLHEINTQIFVTTTDFSLPDSFKLDSLSVITIKDGHILV
ncbi:recombination protein F [compost metagenome]